MDIVLRTVAIIVEVVILAAIAYVIFNGVRLTALDLGIKPKYNRAIVMALLAVSAIVVVFFIALLTTFYGAVMANIVCLPIAGKLRTRSTEEVLVKEMMTEGVICLSNGENPRIVEQKLTAFLAPNERSRETK